MAKTNAGKAAAENPTPVAAKAKSPAKKAVKATAAPKAPKATAAAPAATQKVATPAAAAAPAVSAAPAAPAAPAKPAAKKADPAKAKPETRSEPEAKARKPKLVRDSFTMPEAEYAVLGEIKKTCLKAGIEVKKSELLRAGVALLKRLDTAGVREVLASLPSLKAGRPKKGK